MAPLRILVAGTIAIAAGAANAGERHSSQAPKTYPRFESLYVKRITTPQINCGACYGYYPTQWKSWNEGCGQPDVVYGTQVQETKPEGKPETKPEAKPQDPKTPDPKPIDPKPVEPKKPEVAPPPVTKDPVPLPVPDPKPVEPKKPGESGKSSQAPAPLAAMTVSISIPQVPEPPSIPLVPTMPTVKVK